MIVYYTRYILLFLFTVVLCLFLIPLFVLRPFHPANGHIAASIWGPVAAFLAGVKVTVKGREKVKSPLPCVFLGNHQHALDLFLFSHICPRGTLSVAKSSLGFVPFFGQAYWLAGHLLINRKDKNSAINTLKKMQASMEIRQCSLMIMPEGTRSKNGEIAPFKKGPFRLAMSAGWPVRPIVSSSYNYIDFTKFRAGHIVFEVLDHIDTTDWGLENMDEKMNEVRQKMIASQEKLNEESKAFLEKKKIADKMTAFDTPDKPLEEINLA